MPVSRVLDMPFLASAAPPVARATPSPRPLLPMASAVVVAAVLLLAICLARSSEWFLLLWVANGVAVAAWLRTSRTRDADLTFTGLIAGAAVCGEVLSGAGMGLAFSLALANVVEIVIAVLLARWFAPALNLATVKSACRFILAVAVLAPVPAALIAGLAMTSAFDAQFLTTARGWWAGHALGMVVTVPLLMSLDRRAAAVLRDPRKLLEWAVMLACVCAICFAVYFGQSAHLRYFMVPILITTAVRLRLPGITVALAIISAFALTAIAHGSGPASQLDLPLGEKVLVVQMMLMFGCAPMILVASLLEERDRLSRRARAGQIRAELATAAKSRLLANVAHEIKSPVAGVIGIGELWSSGQLGPITPQQKEMAEMLVKTSRQVETLAHDLLDVARAESGAVKVEIRPTDICGVIEDVRRNTALRPEARALDLQVEFTEPHLIALADSQRITQVIDNLATNAMKYGASGGVIRFSASRIDDRIRIEVADKGRGLSAVKQIELFEPFNRLGLERSTVEGHGIGLALSKRLVELQDGAIGVVSAPNEVATFWIDLPAA
ncbi:ATP-binding protein [Brevundimonas sp.]|uniref:sensor histidine kinase n=1 Tax=Brevundimonas sp. TaxID=1871086 RepID=UPI003BAB1D8F